MRYILIPLNVIFFSFPLFGQSEETIQFETFYKVKEQLSSAHEELEKPFLEENPDKASNSESHYETEAAFEQELHAEIKGQQVTESVQEIDYWNPATLKQNYLTQSDVAEKKSHGILSYRKENGTWGWYDYGDEGNDGKYVGDVVNMKPNGSGIFVYGKGKWEGDKYDGQWKDGEFHGKGTFTRTNGQVFFGEWKKSVLWNITGYDKFGRIIKKYRRGLQLIIEKKDQEEKKTSLQKREIGILYKELPLSKWSRGGKKWTTEGNRKLHGVYEGEILNGVPDGLGTYTWYNVEKYVGEFSKGFFHGRGTFNYLSGITAEGVFRKNKEWDTLHTEKNGEVTGKFVNGRYFPLNP